jgi:hypothetical protein
MQPCLKTQCRTPNDDKPKNPKTMTRNTKIQHQRHDATKSTSKTRKIKIHNQRQIKFKIPAPAELYTLCKDATNLGGRQAAAKAQSKATNGTTADDATPKT